MQSAVFQQFSVIASALPFQGELVAITSCLLQFLMVFMHSLLTVYEYCVCSVFVDCYLLFYYICICIFLDTSYNFKSIGYLRLVNISCAYGCYEDIDWITLQLVLAN